MQDHDQAVNKGKENEISGTILNSSEQPYTNDITIIIKAYKKITTGGYVTKTLTDEEGQFTLEALSPDETYQLRVVAIRNGIVVKDQWVGESNIGVEGRSGAKEFRTLESLVFTFGE